MTASKTSQLNYAASFGPRGTATKSCRFLVDALKEVAGPREFSILQIYYMSRSFSERIILHIGGF